MPDLTNLRRVPETWQKALAVVAHPDDLEYGTASAIARWTNMGKQVMYLLATRGEAGIDSMEPASVGQIREIEQRNSAMIVGVDNVEFLDYPDGVIEYGLDLRRDIARAIRRHRPDVRVNVSKTGNKRLHRPGGADVSQGPGGRSTDGRRGIAQTSD